MGILRRVKIAVEDYLKLPKMQRRDADNREVLDPVPIAPPIGWFKQPSMFDQVRDMVRSEHMRLYAESQGAETFEEASDFEVEDEIFPTSQFEDAEDFEPLADLAARRQREFELEFKRRREARLMAREKAEMDREDAEAAQGTPPRKSSSGAPSAPSKGADEGGSERSERSS